MYLRNVRHHLASPTRQYAGKTCVYRANGSRMASSASIANMRSVGVALFVHSGPIVTAARQTSRGNLTTALHPME